MGFSYRHDNEKLAGQKTHKQMNYVKDCNGRKKSDFHSSSIIHLSIWARNYWAFTLRYNSWPQRKGKVTTKGATSPIFQPTRNSANWPDKLTFQTVKKSNEY